MPKAKPTTPVKRISGGAQIKASGLRSMLLGWEPEFHDLIRQAAKCDQLPMTQFVINSALTAARKKLSEIRRESTKSV